MSMLKVLYDHQIFSLEQYGGVTRYFLELFRCLSESGEVSVNCSPGIFRTAEFDRIRKYAEVVGLRYGPTQARRTARFNNWNSQLVLKYGGYSIFHPTYYNIVQRPAKTALVVTVYDLIHEKIPSLSTATDRTIEMRDRAVGMADLILAISENTKNDVVEKYRINPEKVVVAHLGSTISRTNNREAVCEKPFILYVGRRHSYKNFSLLQKAWTQSVTLQRDLALVCFGGEAPSDSEKAMPGEVHFIKGDDSMAARLYSHAQLLVYPSKYEGFGLPPLEAMQCGCPVICCPNSSIPEVVGDSGIYVDPDSVEDLEQAILKIVSNSETRLKLVQKGLERAQKFSWEKCAQKTLEAYRRVV